MEVIYIYAKRIKFTLFIISSIVLVLCLSPVFWSKTEGLVLENIKNKHYGKTTGGTYDRRYDGTYTWSKVKYQYQVQGNIYNNKSICLCLPLGIEVEDEGSKVDVFYIPIYPSISVLKNKPYMFFPMFLFLLAFSAWAMEKKIENIKNV